MLIFLLRGFSVSSPSLLPPLALGSFVSFTKELSWRSSSRSAAATGVAIDPESRDNRCRGVVFEGGVSNHRLRRGLT